MTAPNCQNRNRCPVPDPVGSTLLPTVALEPGTSLYTVYGLAWSHHLFNESGGGDARFSPIFDDGTPVAHLYGARNPVGALLETALHELRPASRRVPSSSDLAGRGLRRFEAPKRLLLADLRDTALERIGLSRDQIASTSAAHYPCTREWAVRVRAMRPGGRPLAGILWNSRVAELAGDLARPTVAALLDSDASEVCVLWADRIERGGKGGVGLDYSVVDLHATLAAGSGLDLVRDLVVNQLGGLVDD